jgi:RNA polymerase sigma-70 factor, ECF subfamily
MRIAINLQKDHWRNRRMQFWRHTRTDSADLNEAGEWLPSYERSSEQRVIVRGKIRQVWDVVDQLSEKGKAHISRA